MIVDFDKPTCESCLSDKIHARGLCNTCYESRARYGLLGMYPTIHLSAADVVAEYGMLRSAGVPRRDMPARLGMSRGAFDRALARAGVGR